LNIFLLEQSTDHSRIQEALNKCKAWLSITNQLVDGHLQGCESSICNLMEKIGQQQNEQEKLKSQQHSESIKVKKMG